MNYIEVKKWMLGEGLEIKAVAAAAGVSPTTITLTLQNKRFGSYLLVARALRKFKCPKEFLGKAKGAKSKVHRRDACATGGRGRPPYCATKGQRG
ncbi:MAG: hypothetical protein D4R73_02750 [Deltaproteobacteria bacterium]|nr:MAG: hypothetical protein D4R73_02750 [Deltaproteobacteria bacterium]